MVRTYKRKTTRGAYGTDVLQQALDAITSGMSVKKASTVYNIPRPTLRRHRDGRVKCPGKVNLGAFQPVLCLQFEEELVSQIQIMEKALYGLTTNDIRHLAYELACKMKLSHNFNKDSCMAGKDWLAGFMARHKELSLRIPQATSISRAVGFNKAKVQNFFSVYKSLLDSHSFCAQSIWNMDESGISTVQKPLKIIGTKGERQVSRMTSGERGTTVTVICAMNAAGSFIPPMIIFPRMRMAPGLMKGAPIGAIGGVSKSGWTDSDLFLTWLKHFADINKSSKQNQQLIVLDGHHSHKTLAAVEYARDNGINMLTLPPHCTHKMQPLDRTFFKTLKCNYNRAADNWMTSNAAKRITIYEVAELFCKAYDKSAGIETARKGFETTGLWPYDDQKFTDEDFVAAEVTDEPVTTAVQPALDSAEVEQTLDCPEPSTPSTSASTVPVASTSTALAYTPSAECEPHPGLEEARKILNEMTPRPKLQSSRPRTRKAESAVILTSSPYKALLQEKTTGTTARPNKKRKPDKAVKKAPKKAKMARATATETDETPCCICHLRYGQPPIEDWLQCTVCSKWYHESCGPDDDNICYHCL